MIEEELRIHLDDDTYVIKDIVAMTQALNTEEGHPLVGYLEITIELDTALRDLIFQDVIEMEDTQKEDAIAYLTERISDNKKVMEVLRG